MVWNSVLSKLRILTREVPQDSILGPILFLAMIHDMPKQDTQLTHSRVAGYTDDTTMYVKTKNLEHLRSELDRLASEMVKYYNENGLKLNGKKTQILATAREKIEVIIDQVSVSSAQSISLLGLEYNTNLSTAPCLYSLARESNTRAMLIGRLSYGMPNNLLKPLANG